ncbi:S-layer homology domain-containing protein [Gudongella sp. DL1XJH-153]|uniref:S-layer homology domain-containing protein n=1 Tax=Gudongella sp. DL1XJH-153 TaxID=3409804 RepID=UPI003BB4A6B7
MRKILGLILAIIIVIQPLKAEAASFSDVNTNDWYHENITLLIREGAIQGYPDSTFRPQNTITTAEFIKSTMSILGYKDIPSKGTHWADGYISKAISLGIACKETSANPNSPISRYNMARIVSNVLDHQNYRPQADLPQYEQLIKDIWEISSLGSSETKNAVLNSYSSGILTGYVDGAFRGNSTLTRSEAATVLLRIKYEQYRALPEVKTTVDYNQRILDLVNIERAAEGIKPLKLHAELSKVAYEKSKDMAIYDYFSHTSPNYGSPFEMMKEFGISYRYAGENIAMGQPTPEIVVQAWMDSPGHRKNIMSTNFGNLGVGVYNDNGRIYWTQMFIN